MPLKSITPIFIPSPVYPSPQHSEYRHRHQAHQFQTKLPRLGFICQVPSIPPGSNPTSVVGLQASDLVAYKLGSACLIDVVSFLPKLGE